MTASGERAALAVTDPWRTPERAALRRVVAEFTTRELVPQLAGWEAAGELPRELHRRTAQAGLLGVGFPAALGGGGGDVIDSMIVSEQIILSGGSSGLVAGLFTHGIALPHMVATGNADLAERFVRPTLAGAMLGALGVTEPGGGSDVAGLRTRAVRDGDQYVVDGAKLYITTGTRADFVTTAVRTGGPGQQGISLLVLERPMPGFAVSRRLDKMGWRCSDTAELAFDGVRVPAANLIGAEGTGFAQLAANFSSERLGLAVQAYATAARCLQLAIAWTRDRQTFGRPLSTRQLVRHRIADLARQVDVARTYTRSVTARYAAGEPVLLETAMAKNTAVEACDHVVHEAVQLFGGLGLMRESEVERHYRDARVLGIGGGTSEIMNEIIVKLLGM